MNDNDEPIIPEDEEDIDPLKAPILDPDALDETLDDPNVVSIDDLALAEEKEFAEDDELVDEEEDEDEVEVEDYN